MKRNNFLSLLLLLTVIIGVSCEFDPTSVNDPKLQRHIDSLTIVTYTSVQDSLREHCLQSRNSNVKIMADSLVKRSIEDLIKLRPK